VHHGGAQLQVEVALHTLFCHGLIQALYIMVVILKASKRLSSLYRRPYL
jgi:hypothetical protein